MPKLSCLSDPYMGCLLSNDSRSDKYAASVKADVEEKKSRLEVTQNI